MEHGELTEKIIGCAYNVYNKMIIRIFNLSCLSCYPV